MSFVAAAAACRAPVALARIRSTPLDTKPVADGGAGGAVTGGVLLVEGDVVGAERVGDGVAEALGGRVERVVLHKLADADGVVLILGLVAVAAAGRPGTGP